MRNWKNLAIATAALLILTSVAVLADNTDKVGDWWEEMRGHHIAVHGDDFDTHHQEMHGDDWQEHVESCHSTTDMEEMHSGGAMGSKKGSMMGATMM